MSQVECQNGVSFTRGSADAPCVSQSASKRADLHSAERCTHSAVWWAAFLLAVFLPSWLFWMCDGKQVYRSINQATTAALEFPRAHPIHIPQDEGKRDYVQTDHTLIMWQEAMDGLHAVIASSTPSGGISDSQQAQLLFEGEKPRKRSVLQDYRAALITLYFALAGSLYLHNNVHMAVVMLQLNACELLLLYKIKTLDDAVSTAVQKLQEDMMTFALLPIEVEGTLLAQQYMCLHKMEIVLQAWEGTTLGQSIRIPGLTDYVTLNLTLLISLVLATSVRAGEIMVNAFNPSLPQSFVAQKIIRRMLKASGLSRRSLFGSGDQSALINHKEAAAVVASKS
ncbi:hypothetical protein WJX72_009350 [[Myrmecia] bisecta]|uniref:Uncharacterized protein n=1 Tax=[Myrmecia] bisecta TaxID=41462 RepID=A0AAW1QGB2_9CHLO